MNKLTNVVGEDILSTLFVSYIVSMVGFAKVVMQLFLKAFTSAPIRFVSFYAFCIYCLVEKIDLCLLCSGSDMDLGVNGRVSVNLVVFTIFTIVKVRDTT